MRVKPPSESDAQRPAARNSRPGKPPMVRSKAENRKRKSSEMAQSAALTS